MELAPIVLFVYNRPEHTLKTLRALSENDLADKSELYIFADGPKPGADSQTLEDISRTREVLGQAQWCKEVHILERETNIGLANSVIDGVTQIVNKYGKVIVLEDDIVTSTGFLTYMNIGLNMYTSETRVYGISGYKFPSFKPILDDTFFLPIMSSWGYGTWKDRWNRINFDAKDLFEKVKIKGVLNKLNFGNLNFKQMLIQQIEGEIDSWAIRFYVSMFLDKGLFLYPRESLLINIGFDGSGVHCNDDPIKNEEELTSNVIINCAKLKVNLKKSILKKYIPNNYNIIKVIKRNKRHIRVVLSGFKSKLQNKFFGPKLGGDKLILEKIRESPRFTRMDFQINNMNLTIPDSASFYFMYKEIFHQHIYKFITDVKEPYIIDGGANIGLSSIYLKRLFPNSKIIAFEPDPNIFNYLVKNITQNNINGVELINKGLWNREDSLKFKSEGADGGVLQAINPDSDFTEVSVDLISLRPYLNEKIDFLKLDIEGAETVVLNDIFDVLDNVDRIFVEYHSMVGQPQTLNEVIDRLTKSNFRLFISSPGFSNKSPLLERFTYNNMDMQLNIFGIKNNLL
ncbi:FkbM family methyltransferase [Aegicerativicinus sediminis]|uniref:FkbM family methyltransferase n=1 Tax=Aegicerativicinus sediminis TaxID=2893202 RepID=UPI001E4C9EE5|nr:FkbM family methyltransferase [Aegicerativicinus sediminis]